MPVLWRSIGSPSPPDARFAGVEDIQSVLDLLDWKRRVFALYSTIREHRDPAAAWSLWQAARDDLFRSHPQSPLGGKARADFEGLDLYPYDPDFRVLAELEPAKPQAYNVPASGDETFTFTRVGIAHFDLAGAERRLELYWLTSYGGGLFVPFRDATSGRETYGAGRYLLDTVKGADLGMQDGRLVLDFNFAYNPSCSYDPRWVCPLAPPANALDLPVTAGERT